MEQKNTTPFTSRMSRFEYAAAIGYIPVHVYLLPRLLYGFFGEDGISAVGANVVCYTAAAVILFFCLRRFLFREFNALCDCGPGVLLEVAKSYGFLLLCNLAASLVLLLATGEMENPNNAAIFDLAAIDTPLTVMCRKIEAHSEFVFS